MNQELPAHQSRRRSNRSALQVLAAILCLTIPSLVAAASLGDVPLARIDEMNPVTARVNLAIDDLSVPAADRQARLTLVIDNPGAVEALAVCPLLNFEGSLRSLQGYGYLAGDGVPECSALVDHVPSASLSIDPIQPFPPACPAPAPVTGDIEFVPADNAGQPGRLELRYAIHLADFGAGLELLGEDEVRAALTGAGGLRLEALTNFGSAITDLVCPSGVDAFLAAAPAPEVASITSRWLVPPVATSDMVMVPTSLSSARTIGEAADLQAVAHITYTDNLPTPLSGNLTLDPPEGSSFTLSPGTFAGGTLTATFPPDLPEGFVGQAMVVVSDEGTGEELARSIHLFANDTLPPDITAARTERGTDTVDATIEAADAGSFINSSRLVASVDGVTSPSSIMDLVAGNFEGPTSFDTTIDSLDESNSVGAVVSVSDELGNAFEATLPVAGAGVDTTVECTSPDGATVTLDGSLSTTPPEAAPTLFTWSDGFGTANGEIVDVVLPLGTHDVRLDLEDTRGFTGTDNVQVTVVDTTPPVINSITLTPDCLWPPNHKYVKFGLGDQLMVDATDVCDADVAVRIVDVVSSEPDTSKGQGAGNTSNDVVFGSGGFCARSERSGKGGQDRIYTVTVEAMDDSGNLTMQTAEVRVAHDQSNHNCPALDPSLFLADGDMACDPASLELPVDPGSPGSGLNEPPDDGSGTVPPGLSKKELKKLQKAAKKAAKQAKKAAKQAAKQAKNS